MVCIALKRNQMIYLSRQGRSMPVCSSVGSLVFKARTFVWNSPLAVVNSAALFSARLLRSEKMPWASALKLVRTSWSLSCC